MLSQNRSSQRRNWFASHHRAIADAGCDESSDDAGVGESDILDLRDSSLFMASRNEWHRDPRVWDIIAEIFASKNLEGRLILNSSMDYGYLREKFPWQMLSESD